MTATPTADRIDSATLLARAGTRVLDVRTPAEYETRHIEASVNVPLDVLQRHTAEVVSRLDGPVVVACQTGTRALDAQRTLRAAGATDVAVLDGGVPGYAAAGGPTVTGRQKWALERQVRLVAGSIVLTSVLASLRRPKARFLAGGIGAGLTFAAVTDTCAMGRVLMALPYNKGPRTREAGYYLDQL